ncbi:hypothetical protein LX36DRAFT_666990 [Colletotrichum falcatum]|nr:hypothetical protein LX36DRAFT_666990 [Colletotrichum falcatum]
MKPPPQNSSPSTARYRGNSQRGGVQWPMTVDGAAPSSNATDGGTNGRQASRGVWCRQPQDEENKRMETVNEYQRDSRRQARPSSSGRNPLRTVWRETYEVWDGVCYGVGKAYYKMTGKL